jgi:hypothetical protein
MDALTLFGLFAVTAMLVFYALEERGPFNILGFAAACALGSVYGFLQGAWPFGVVEAIWAGVALRRWIRASGTGVPTAISTSRGRRIAAESPKSSRYSVIPAPHPPAAASAPVDSRKRPR